MADNTTALQLRTSTDLIKARCGIFGIIIQNEYKYLTVFVLQKTRLDRFSTKLTSLIAKNALFSKEIKGRSQILSLNMNKFL